MIDLLRAADPCPAPVGYDDTVAQRNIDTIVRTDLTVRPAVAPRRRRRAWLAVAAVAVGLAVAGSVVGVEIAREDVAPSATDGAWETFSANGVSFEYPAAWVSYPYEVVSTRSYLYTYLSTVPVPEPCVTTSTSTQVEISCQGPQVSLAAGGVLVVWTGSGRPGWSLENQPGTPTVLAGRPARVERSAPQRVCDGIGAVRSVEASIELEASNMLTMTACIGPGDVDTDLAAVDRMLASVQLSP